MLFHLDRQAKQNILEHYRQEALKSRLKKEEEKKKEMEEDKANLELKEKRQKATIDLMNEEILFNRNKLKKEYNLMLQKTKGYIPRKTDIIIKNWGQSKDQFILPEVKTNNSSKNDIFISKSFLNNYSKKDFIHLTPIQKEKEILKQVDHMHEYLTDKQNLNEIKQYFLVQKENRHNFYKDLLYSQYKNALNKNLNLYGTKDALILKNRKKKFISDNPYIKKRKYDFGTSSLDHNPIVNPENNYNYNKYINYQSFAAGLNSLNNSRNNNNKIYKIKSLNNLENNLYNNQKNVVLNNNQNSNKNNAYDRYSYNNNTNNNLNERNNKEVYRNILGNINNNYNLNSNKPILVTNNENNINNNQNLESNDYNLRRNFSQGDIYV